MHKNSTRILIGPNIHHDRSVVVMSLPSDAFARKTPADDPGLASRIEKSFPGLEIPSSYARLAERIALELSEKARVGVKRMAVPDEGRANPSELVVPFLCENSMKLFLRAAIDWLRSGEPEFPFRETLREADEFLLGKPLSLSTRALLWAAEQRKIPIIPMFRRNTYQLGTGRHRRMIQASRTNFTSVIATNNAADKQLTKEILHGAGIPVPRGGLAFSLDEAKAIFNELQEPVVVKPHNGNHGDGITKEIKDEASLEAAYKLAREHSSRVIVETHFHGTDFRALVIDGKLAAVCKMIPARVFGDGKHTIAELIDIENKNPARGEPHTAPLAYLQNGPEEKEFLQRSGQNLSDVPAAGEQVFLRATSNGSVGGTPEDVTDQVHPGVRLLCERTARALDLDACGIDLILADITHSVAHGTPCGVIEVNSCPGLHGHLWPGEPEPRHVASLFMDMLFPSGAESTIPVIAVVGDDGLVLQIAETLSRTGMRVGAASSDGVFIQGARITKRSDSFPDSARVVLTNPCVDVAVFSVSAEQIEKEGMGFDTPEVVLLLTGSNSPRAEILLAERIRDGGTLIVNADDPKLRALLDSPGLQALRNREKIILAQGIASGTMPRADTLAGKVLGLLSATFDRGLRTA